MRHGRLTVKSARLHPDLVRAKEAELGCEENPFDPNTRVWRFFNKVREACANLRTLAREGGAA